LFRNTTSNKTFTILKHYLAKMQGKFSIENKTCGATEIPSPGIELLSGKGEISAVKFAKGSSGMQCSLG
jgi:hypothetical protein